MRAVNPEATVCTGRTAGIDSLGKRILLGLAVPSAFLFLAGPASVQEKWCEAEKDWRRGGMEKDKGAEGNRGKGSRERDRARGEKHVSASVTHKQGLCVGGVNSAAKSLLCRGRLFCFCSFLQLA